MASPIDIKKITTVLFDLDGTLIRMDQDEFIRLYFTAILDKLTSLGYDKALMYQALEKAIFSTKRNNGEMTNEARFWQVFNECVGGEIPDLSKALDEFYSKEYSSVILGSCAPYERAGEVLEAARRKGLRIVLATNPLFPAEATYKRIRLGGMSVDDFEYVTAYENSSFCKPSSSYFTELLEKLGLRADECVMIGNDTRDDFCALALGIPVFVLTECLINRDGVDLSEHPHGGFDELIAYINALNT